MRRPSLFALLFCLCATSATAQAPEIETSVSATAALGTRHALPFWLTANRHGVLDYAGAHALVRAAALRPFAGRDGFDVAAGLDLVARRADRNAAYVHQGWAAVRYGRAQLTVGRREETMGRVDTLLTSGSAMQSANATPLPRISIQTTGYVSLPGTRGHAAVRGYLAHGWFAENRFVEGARLHQKYLYLRLLRPDSPVRVHAGVVHSAIWGGVHPVFGRMPSGLNDLLRVALGNKDLIERGDPEDRTGASSDGLAIYDVSVDVDLPGAAVTAYRQFYFEDRPGALFRSPWDGLWGLSLRLPDAPMGVRGVLYEHLFMSRMGARYSDGEPRGADNYYNHGTYRAGWTYHKRTLGNPLLVSDGRRYGVYNNIVAAHHVGVLGSLGHGVDYRLVATASRNYGARQIWPLDGSRRTSGRFPRRDQLSAALTLAREWTEGFASELTLAADVGELHPRGAAAALTLRWRVP